MKRFNFGFGSLLMACVFALAAAFTWVGAQVAHVVHTAYVSVRALKNLLVDTFKSHAHAKALWADAAPFARARSFVARIVKRERPVLTNSWRMCPST